MNKSLSKGIDWSAGEEKTESALEHFWASRKWDQHTILALVLGALAVIIPMFVIFRGYFGSVETRSERSLIVSLLEIYAFLKFPLGRGKWSDRLNWVFIIDFFLIFLTVITQFYTLWDAQVLETDDLKIRIFSELVKVDHIVGIIVVILLLEAVRRAFGWILVILPLIFITYTLTASHFPGPFQGVQANWTFEMEILYVMNEGVYGIGVQVLLAMVFLYLLFGMIMKNTKVGAFFLAVANSLAGRYAGGPAKVAVISSAGMGSISGSAIANVGTTGSITIPMMKSIGYKPAFAGAVEACASTAGYFTPPIMGAAAFLMAHFTGIPYFRICLYVAIPATLFFLGVFMQVHFRAKKEGLVGMPKAEIPSFKRVMLEGGYLIIPVLVLLITLGIGFSVTKVAIWGIFAILLVSFFRKETRITPRKFLTTLEQSTDSTVGVCLSVIIAGVIVGTLMVTGLGMRMSLLVETVAGGHLIYGLLLAAAVSIILGMGLPSVLVYLILSVFVIPALVEMGTVTIAAHVFALMFGAAAMITPPVCLAAYAAASIAGASPLKTGFEASKLGFAGYLVPFLFVFHPALLAAGGATPIDSVVAILSAAIGIICIAGGFEGWLFKRTVPFERILLLVAGGCLVAPQLFLSFIGLALLVFIILSQRFRQGATRADKYEI